MNPRVTTFVFLALLTTASALLAGKFGNRWGVPVDMTAAANKLADVPTSFGPWEIETEDALDPLARETLECAGEVVRTYRHREKGDVVRMALLVGPPGPLSVHTPEICYSSRDFSKQREPEHLEVLGAKSRRHQLWAMPLKANDVDGQSLDVAYGWNAGDGWLAPKEARFSFGGKSLLYKLQIAVPVASGPADTVQADSACVRFLQDLLPVLDTALFSQEGT